MALLDLFIPPYVLAFIEIWPHAVEGAFKGKVHTSLIETAKKAVSDLLDQAIPQMEVHEINLLDSKPTAFLVTSDVLKALGTSMVMVSGEMSRLAISSTDQDIEETAKTAVPMTVAVATHISLTCRNKSPKTFPPASFGYTRRQFLDYREMLGEEIRKRGADDQEGEEWKSGADPNPSF